MIMNIQSKEIFLVRVRDTMFGSYSECTDCAFERPLDASTHAKLIFDLFCQDYRPLMKNPTIKTDGVRFVLCENGHDSCDENDCLEIIIEKTNLIAKYLI